MTLSVNGGGPIPVRRNSRTGPDGTDAPSLSLAASDIVYAAFADLVFDANGWWCLVNPRAFRQTGASGVYSRLLLNNSYVIMEGQAIFTPDSTGYFTITLPEAFPDIGYSAFVTDTGNAGAVFTAFPLSAGIIRGYAVSAGGAPRTVSSVCKYFCIGHGRLPS